MGRLSALEPFRHPEEGQETLPGASSTPSPGIENAGQIGTQPIASKRKQLLY